MSLELMETTQGRVVEVHVTGKLNAEAYKRFGSDNGSSGSGDGKIRILLVLHDFHGWIADALWRTSV